MLFPLHAPCLLTFGLAATTSRRCSPSGRVVLVGCQSEQKSFSTLHAVKPFQLPHTEGSSKVFLFGVEHNSCQDEPAQFILEQNPAAVVFENSFSAAGGNGACVSCTDPTSLDGSDLVMLACSTAARLQSSPPPVFDYVWQQLKEQCETELLAHMAAFVTNAEVIHADQPKPVTYDRMNRLVPVADLDLAIAAQVCINYADVLGCSCGHEDLSQAALVHHTFTNERDQIMCQSLQRAAQTSSQCVVGIVGSAHVQGIIKYWNLSSSSDTASSYNMSTEPLQQEQASSPVEQGIRRALLQRFVELSCSSAVCADMQRQLIPLPPEALHAYNVTQELYGSPRMLLAALPREHLHKVCSGWRCHIWDVLKPVRDARPTFGGSAHNEDLVLDLRQLFFDLG